MTKFARYVKKYGALPRLTLVAMLIFFTLGIFFGQGLSHIANIDLIFHEAGHVIFYLLGETLHILGGTLMQIAVPGALLYYFCTSARDYFASGVMLWWLGENLTNVGTYMRDTNVRQLDLIGTGHDWHILFSKWNLLQHAELIGDLFWHTGIMTLLTGLMWALMYSYKKTVPLARKL